MPLRKLEKAPSANAAAFSLVKLVDLRWIGGRSTGGPLVDADRLTEELARAMFGGDTGELVGGSKSWTKARMCSIGISYARLRYHPSCSPGIFAVFCRKIVPESQSRRLQASKKAELVLRQ